MIRFNVYEEGGAPVFFLEEGKMPEDACGRELVEREIFTGKKGEVFYYPVQGETGKFFAGLGKIEELEENDLRILGFTLGNLAKKNKVESLEMKMPDLDRCNRRTLMAVYEGFLQGEYAFSMKEEKKEKPDLIVNYTPFKGPKEILERAKKRVEDQMAGVFLARDLVNQTSNLMDPETLANCAVEMLEPFGVRVTVYEKKAIEDMGLSAFLAVGQGSDKEPRLIIMEYQGDPDSEERTGLVGKGLTYDSGGYCIKTPGGMVDMHSDMGGAGTVIGTLYALAKSKAKTNVVGVVAACENLISGHAYKTGDIISSLSGKTIEVVNTDAEGRITLADAVYYATKELAVDRVIDLATLTGAVLTALGEEYTGAVTNNKELLEAFTEGAEAAGEKVWELPNDPAFKENNKSDVADIRNSGGRNAGSITAGQFVGEFVYGTTPWLHLDIAGTAYKSKAENYLPKRATGVHVKALYNLLNPLEDCH